MKVVLVAVPGAGKTTIIQLLKRKKPDIKVVNYGDYMFKIARDKYGIKDRDQIRTKLSLDEYRQVQLEAAKEIGKLKGDIVIDTHLAIKTKKGYYPGLPNDVAQELKPDVIVILEFNPKDVIERRLKDMKIDKPVMTEIGTIRVPRPGRDLETEEEIDLHQEINRIFGVVVSNQTKATLKIINLRNIVQKEPYEHSKIVAEILRQIFDEPMFLNPKPRR